MRILVVEDEKDIRDLLKKTFLSEAYAVDTANDGEQGLEMALANEYNLIVLDNNLPKRSGLEVCRALRSKSCQTPIMMLSVLTETNTKVDLLNAGADDYLTKPFSNDELHARVKALLRRPLRLENEQFEIDDLKLDPERHTVFRKNKEIFLTRKELMLLKYMMRNRGIVLSRSMIMEHVWDMTVDPFSNTIESHIVSLRKKIDLPGSKKLIHTISGRGYRLDILD